MSRLLKEIKETNAQVGNYTEKLMLDMKRGKRLFLESVWFIEDINDKKTVKITMREIEKDCLVETTTKNDETTTKTYKIPDLTDVFIIIRKKYTKIIRKQIGEYPQKWISATLWEITKNGKLLLRLRHGDQRKTVLSLPPIKWNKYDYVLFGDIHNLLEDCAWMHPYGLETNIALKEMKNEKH